MKTAVLLKTNLLNDPPENVSLKERHNIKLAKLQVSESNRDKAISGNKPEYANTKCRTFKDLLSIYNISVNVNNSLLSSTTIRILSLITLLHSLRWYFKNKINIYFCEECLTYFKEVILCEKLWVCSKCVNTISSSYFQISAGFNLLYSSFYPLEPKAFIMGCICKWKVLQKRPYILCSCIYSHNHIDHNVIFKRIVKSETKLLNKIFDLQSMKYTSQENVFDIFKKIQDCGNFQIFPFHTVVLNNEVSDFQIEFYESCNSLYELFISYYSLHSEENDVKHSKGFVRACSSKTLFPNFRCMFRNFVLFYVRTLDIFSPTDVEFNDIADKLKFFHPDYSELMLLFGFYVYCLKILNFCRERSVTVATLLLKFVDRWQKRHMLKVFLRICYLYNYQFIKTKTLKNYVYKNVQVLQDFVGSKEGQFSENNVMVLNNESVIEKRNDENQTGVENLGDVSAEIGNFDILEVSPVVTNSLHHLEAATGSNNCFEKSIPLDSHLRSSAESILPVNVFSTGKEELDVIDGVNIYSFETEDDMLEYSQVQSKHLCVQDVSDSGKVTNFGRIIPTKTRDITKIKGWRNKLFCINKNEKNHVNCPKSPLINSANYNQTDGNKCGNVKIKEELLENTLKIKEEPFEYNAKGEMERLCDRLKVKNEQWNFDYLKCKKEFIQNLKHLYHHVLSEDLYFKNLSKQTKDDEPQGIFKSTILDEYLQNHSDLKISFKLPATHSLLSSPEKRNSSVFPIEVKKSESQRLKYEQMKEKVKKLSSVDFIKNMQGDITQRKFIWVQGRPIMIEQESKKTTNSSSKKRLANNMISNSSEEKANSEKEENDIKKIKITKQLKYSDTVLSENDHSEFVSIKPASQLEIKPKKPYLSLLNTFQIDGEIDEERNIHSNALSKQKFPLIFPCTSVNNGHSKCTKFTQIQLVMVINIGYKRPFLREVVNNIEKLKKEATTIDSMWAHIAASAVRCNKAKRTVKRYIIPVVSDSLIEVVKFNIENVSTNIGKLNELNVHSVYRSICASQTGITNVENEIKDVVNDIIDYVVKKDQYELLTIPYDPDIPNPQFQMKLPVKKAKKSKVERELKRLINVTLVDDWHETSENSRKESCANEHCLKGCICNSLNSKVRVLHCGKLECMFECSCDTKTNYSLNCFIQHGRNEPLAKDESSWHQTVICKNNEVIEVKAGAGKSKREKKLPTRYRNNVLLGKEMNCLDFLPLSPDYSKKSNVSQKLPSPNKDKDIKSKEKEGKCKDKETKIKVKEAKIREKDKDTKIKEKDKDTKIKEKDKESRVIEADKDSSIKDTDTEALKNDSDKIDKIKEKHIDIKPKEEKNREPKISEKGNEKYGKIHGSKIILPVKTVVKKVNSKHRALISENLKQILNHSDLKKMAKICHEETNHSLTLADVFVWCSIHCRYSCPCSAQVFILKNNRLVWKPTANSTHLTPKHMSQIVINSSMPKYHVYDRHCFSARTFGSIFNYKLRNCNPVFKSKRLNEIVNDVLSNTNSFIKINFSSIKKDSNKLQLQNMKEIDASKPTVKVINNSIFIKQKLTLEANHLTPEVKKRKRSFIELENENVEDKMKPTTYVIGNKHEIVFQNAKKRYRIGPAHFDCTGSYRSIVTNISPKSITKPKMNEHVILNLTEQEIVPSVSVKEAKDNESKTLPKYGLLCLTQGFGYLPVKEFTQKKLQVQDPLSENVFHCFKDIGSANKWLNRFFKNRIIFESLNVNLKWVIVKPGILKHSQPFDKSLLENPTKIVNKDGFLVDVTNINGSIPHRVGATSSLVESQQLDEDKKARILGITNDIRHEIHDIPHKKAKISGTAREEKNVPVRHGIINLKLIKKPTGFFSRVNYDSCPSKSTVVSSTNVSNHSSFFRLNSSPDSSFSEGRFIPLVPTCTAKEPFQPHNGDSAKCRDTEPELLSNILSSKSSNTLFTTDSKTNSQENLIVNRIAKTIPFSIKALPGKSILKTKFK